LVFAIRIIAGRVNVYLKLLSLNFTALTST